MYYVLNLKLFITSFYLESEIHLEQEGPFFLG